MRHYDAIIAATMPLFSHNTIGRLIIIDFFQRADIRYARGG